MKSDFWLLFVILSLRMFIHVLQNLLNTYTLMFYRSDRDRLDVYVACVILLLVPHTNHFFTSPSHQQRRLDVSSTLLRFDNRQRKAI
jgi:hypothetical protein